jgi:hypothetical protein
MKRILFSSKTKAWLYCNAVRCIVQHPAKYFHEPVHEGTSLLRAARTRTAAD